MAWIKLPTGMSQLSIEQQLFEPEFADADGRTYFRVPDHFVPTIMELGGFERVKQPEGAPDDLPKESPKASQAIETQQIAIKSLQDEVVLLRREVKDLTAERDALKKSVDGLESELDAQDKLIKELKSAEKEEKKPQTVGE